MKVIKKIACEFVRVDETKPLHRNKIFWLATISPLVISAMLSAPLAGNLAFEFSKEGYDLFLSTFKFPLWLSSSSLVFGVMVGRFHGSAQRATTINQSKLQNNFSNYLSHRDHFQKYMQSVSDELDLKIDAFKIYGVIFSSSTPNGVDINISNGIYDYYAQQFEEQFWSKMKFASPNFTKDEVDIYFPRFAKSIGVNAEKLAINDYESLKSVLIRIRKLYRRGMEYGSTRTDSVSVIEFEESGFATLTGEFDLWSNQKGFKNTWGNLRKA